nr:MAG TPA: hypothetical protein [Caudoviricetes sp.]
MPFLYACNGFKPEKGRINNYAMPLASERLNLSLFLSVKRHFCYLALVASQCELLR